MNDLDTRLERLATEATRDTVAPPVAAVARRGRRRRRRQHAGAALLVAAVAAAGLVLPARLTGRPGGGDQRPAVIPATDVSGAGLVTGHWFGRTDATVFLDQFVPATTREAVRRRIEALDMVDEVYFESRREAWDRFKVLHKARPEVVARTDPAGLSETFRVRLDDPAHFERLYLALCRPVAGPSGMKPSCIDGVDSVADDLVTLKPLLVRRSPSVADATVVLADGTGAAERRAIRVRLEAIDGVRAVRYRSPAEAFRALVDKFRKDPNLALRLRPEAMPASFEVTLDRPAEVEAFHRALCGSRRTGDCPFGLVVLEHPRGR